MSGRENVPMIALGVAISLCAIVGAVLTGRWWLLAAGIAALGASLWRATHTAPLLPPDDPEGQA